MILPLYLLSAVWLGFIVAVPPGAVTVIGIQYALTGKLKKTFLFIAGSSLADCIYLILVYAGIAAVMSADRRFKILLYFISGCLFIYIGLQTAFAVWNNRMKTSVNMGEEKSVGDQKSKMSVFAKGLAVTLTNPTTIVGWLGAGGNFFLIWRSKWIGSLNYEPLAICFIMIGVELWFFPMLYFIYRTHKKITFRTHTILMTISAVIILVMGISALLLGAAELLGA